MQVIRTATWALITGLLVAFVAINWTPVPVIVWPFTDPRLMVTWPVGLLVLVSFALGWLPTWLFSAVGRWRMRRRMAHLENAVRAQAAVAPVVAPVPAPDLEGE